MSFKIYSVIFYSTTTHTASAVGDPHFNTFDGTFYTFNGHGEFWLMKVDRAVVHGAEVDFALQARMVVPPNTNCKWMIRAETCGT